MATRNIVKDGELGDLMIPFEDEGLTPHADLSRPPLNPVVPLNLVEPLNPVQNAPLADPGMAIEVIITEFMEIFDDGWDFDELEALYIRYIRYVGYFTAIQNCTELAHRSVAECVLKIFADHNYCVSQIIDTPWNLLDDLLHIDRVQPYGHFALMLNGGGYPEVDIAAAATALEEGASIVATLHVAFARYVVDAPAMAPYVAIGLADAAELYGVNVAEGVAAGGDGGDDGIVAVGFARLRMLFSVLSPLTVVGVFIAVGILGSFIVASSRGDGGDGGDGEDGGNDA